MRKLEIFTLFLDLPLEIRNYIWRMATPRERIVFVKEGTEYPKSDFEPDEGREDEKDENSRSIQNLDKRLEK
jgi:hypothetical protein